jgi:SRSO17 transposase
LRKLTSQELNFPMIFLIPRTDPCSLLCRGDRRQRNVIGYEESEPTKYWLSTLPEKTSLKSLVKIAKHRWIIERDYEELKQELGLGHYEGRGWRGFHHHASLCIAAYGFLVAERNRFSPSARAGPVGLSAPQPPKDFRPGGSPRSPRTS